MNSEEWFADRSCEDQMRMAERELSAFIGAVTKLFGPEQSTLSTEDWLDESKLMHISPRSTNRDWRAVTVAASARLANRLAASQGHRTRPASSDAKASPIPSSNCFASAFLV